MEHHYIKCESKYFRDIFEGSKIFEIRKNDRNYKIGDYVFLMEIKEKKKTGFQVMVEIKYIFHGGKYGLKKNYCIFSW